MTSYVSQLEHLAERPRPRFKDLGSVKLLRRMLAVRLVGPALVVIGVVILVALLADVLSPYDPLKQDYRAFMQAPSWAHPLGTDNVGRDILSRMLHGARISLVVGLVAMGIAAVCGAVIGLMAGYLGGLVDAVLMRVVDAIWCFPSLVLALSLAAVLGPGITNVMIAIGIVYTPAYARLVRGQAVALRERDFVVAARAVGASNRRIMVKHIWPNVTAPIIVQASLSVGTALIAEASLSFLGVGVRPPAASWGSILRTGYQYMETAPWMSIFPGLVIFLVVLSFNLAGDGLRQALDPRLRDKRIG